MNGNESMNVERVQQMGKEPMVCFYKHNTLQFIKHHPAYGIFYQMHPKQNELRTNIMNDQMSLTNLINKPNK